MTLETQNTYPGTRSEAAPTRSVENRGVGVQAWPINVLDFLGVLSQNGGLTVNTTGIMPPLRVRIKDMFPEQGFDLLSMNNTPRPAFGTTCYAIYCY